MNYIVAKAHARNHIIGAFNCFCTTVTRGHIYGDDDDDDERKSNTKQVHTMSTTTNGPSVGTCIECAKTKINTDQHWLYTTDWLKELSINRYSPQPHENFHNDSIDKN